ncbi:MAG: endonuclease/exonuclease/phosphatase family protein [Anaerovoracaceae bacterium]
MKIIKIVLAVVLSVIAVVAIYVSYVFIDYNRIADNQTLEITKKTQKNKYEKKGIELDKVFFEIETYNIGYGAYSRDYTFFMDGGKESRAKSKDEVHKNTDGVIKQMQDEYPDFMLVQEMDIKSDRSFYVDQKEIFEKKFPEYDSDFAVNYDSSYLFYPVLKPIGKSLSGIMTMSQYDIKSAVRRSLPISTGFSKFFDLDRCYSVSEVNLGVEKNLYIYNVHLSAYGGSPEIRKAQMDMLFSDMREKEKEGHFVIAGGDFNHDFTGTSAKDLNGTASGDDWAQPFPDEYLGNEFVKATNYKDGKLVPTTRNNDIPYEKGKSTVYIIDGFIVSKNIEIGEVENIYMDFNYTDHQPVKMLFRLIRE